MKAIFCKGFNAHYNDAILNVAINSKLNSADLHLTNGGGGRKSRLCASHYPLNFKFSLYALLFIFLTFLYFKFLVVASECIAQVWLSIIFFIDCHAKNRLCSFLLAMTAKQKFKFFTQNSRHFVISTHFINLTQILSLTQGFFIFLPQVFAQCKLIKNFLQGGHCV